MKTINVFHISPFPYHSGGIDTWLFQFITIFDHKFKINLICPISKNIIPSIARYDISNFNNLNIIYIKEKKNNIFYSLFIRPFIYFKQLRNNKEISKASVNLILSTYPVGFTVKFLRYLTIIDGHFYLSVRGCVGRDMIDLNQSYFVRKIFFWLEKYAMKNIDLLIANGDDTKNYIQNFYNFNSVVIPNAIDFNFVKNKHKSDKLDEIKKLKNNYAIVSHIGTLRKIKNIDTIIRSFSIFQREYNKPVILVLAGKGNINYYAKQANNLKINVRFLGELNTNEVNELLLLSNVVLNISYGCGISNSLLESMKYNCKVVSFNRDTFNQVIKNGYNGYLAKDQNCDDFANKINFALEDTNLVINNIQQSIKKFDSKTIFKQWDHLLS